MTNPTVNPITPDDVEWRFAYHAPDAEARAKHEAFRANVLHLARWMQQNIPPGREAALAMTTLQSAMMWGNAAIACERKNQ